MHVCPVCCKPLKYLSHTAYCDDDNGANRWVGRDCWKRIQQAGVVGYKQPGDPGPRWYSSRQMALNAKGEA